MNNVKRNYFGKIKTIRRQRTKKTVSTVKSIFRMDEAGKRQFRDSAGQTAVSSDSTSSNGFLKIRFLPKMMISENTEVCENSKNAKKTERDFFKSLNQLTKHYNIDQLPVGNFKYPYNIALSIWHTAKMLRENKPHFNSLQLVQDNDERYLISEERYNTSTTLFYIPVIPLYHLLKNKTRKKSAQLLLSVCSYLYKNADIPYYRQQGSYLYWNYEMLSDWLSDDEEIDENHIIRKELLQAEMIGDYMEQKISNDKNLEIFMERINTFKPTDDFDRKCFQIAKSTFELYSDYPNESIFRNAHFNNLSMKETIYVSEDDEEKVITMDKYISFFANDYGSVYQNLVDGINNEFNEYAELQEPVIIKTFNGKSLDNVNLDFEDRLFRIVTDLINILG
ncbi:hypothetical protein NG800_010850 [Epilithonimonas ginsengisoli]|uniref:TerB N-terminal domain-containing protein n=1 Tax=Epilithonimonas ginsengisoli TaxID=1245592 RepID=A0ABU4JIA1_9FLAO|nr:MULTISPECIES: hypothetical protein [Chryseobacterium group]MDW8549411.1 hypothetical protein [Epilithonimonas ginsengisoli]